MSDQQKFGKRVQELLHRKGLRQHELAERLGVTESYLSHLLSGTRPLTPDRAKTCILFLAEAQAVLESGQVYDLLKLAGCEDFAAEDWRSWPLKDLISSEASPLEQAPPQQRYSPLTVV